MVVSERVKCGWHQFMHILQVDFAEVYEKFVMLVIVGFACYYLLSVLLVVSSIILQKVDTEP